jgi:acyl-CoA thioester hydrolase
MFEHRFSPRYLEVDQLGVVFNMWYLEYFDGALAAFFAHLGHPYPGLMAGGHDVMLVRSEQDWSAGLRYGDDATTGVSVEHLGRTSFTLRFDVSRVGDSGGRESVCIGRTVYVVVARDGSGKREIPPSLRTAMAEHLVAAGRTP